MAVSRTKMTRTRSVITRVILVAWVIGFLFQPQGWGWNAPNVAFELLRNFAVVYRMLYGWHW